MGQVRIFLDAIVIAKKSSDPSFGRIRKEETKLVFNSLEVRKVPIVVEGGAAPVGTTGR